MRRIVLPALVIGLLALGWSATSLAEDRKDREFQECAECPVMVGIPAGTFVMGPAKPRAGASTPRDQHEVAIKAFALGKYDVTSEQFLTFLKETGYQPRPCSTILDMKWKSPGHGQAYSPLNGEPPHWPAVCLDWHDVKNISPG